MDVGRAPPSSTVHRLAERSDGVDRLKTALLIAAAFATVMVGVVAARSLLLSAKHPAPNAQVAR